MNTVTFAGRFRAARVVGVLGLLAALWPAGATLSAGPATAPADSASRGLTQLYDMQSAFASIAEKVAPSVVAIEARRKLSSLDVFGDEQDDYLRRFGDRLVPAVGSGIIIESAGYILTNDHVVGGAEKLEVVLANRHRHEAKLIGSDPRSDLALIKIEAKGLPTAALGDLATVRQGHWAIAMGNAFGLAAEGKPSMTVGIVSAIGRVLPSNGDGDRHYGNLIQTSADINPGNSGGPLLNLAGQVIGVNTAISSRSGVSEGVGFAVPITPRVRTIIELLKAGKKVEYGFLGVIVRSPAAEESTRAGAPPYVGAIVDVVDANTPAAKAKIQAGDVVVRVDAESIQDSDHLVRLIGESPIGKAVELTFWRDKKMQTATVVLEKRSEVLARKRTESGIVQWRGMTLGELNDERRKALKLAKDVAGVEVLAVDEKGPAKEAGLKAGDVIDKLEARTIKSLDDLRKAIESADESKDISIHTLKGGAKTIKQAQP